MTREDRESSIEEDGSEYRAKGTFARQGRHSRGKEAVNSSTTESLPTIDTERTAVDVESQSESESESDDNDLHDGSREGEDPEKETHNDEPAKMAAAIKRKEVSS